jgi:hypothetical protein
MLCIPPMELCCNTFHFYRYFYFPEKGKPAGHALP